VELGRPHRPTELRDMLARALGDPSLQLAFWLPASGHYVDGEGRPVTPPRADDRRGATVLSHDGHPLAALGYDASLLEEPALVEGVAGAARLALENSRLQAELRARLLEVRESRTRIVAAADAERRRIERNLHDGAQQTLLAVRLAVRLARNRTGEGPEVLDDRLEEIDAELKGALEELRALAHGLHPPVLSEQGLEPALETLARRASLPVQVSCRCPRLATAVETAVYYVAAEALANVIKHAHASGVRIDVALDDGHAVIAVDDDGDGGADPDGSGLRGLRDRVEALDGTFEITSGPTTGTRLRAEIPCE
jgi:signal transduction histidine kinase